MFHRVTVLVPVYGPDGRLATLLDALAPEFPRIVVIDDGSPEPFRAPHPNVTVLRHAVNRGKGAALKTGLAFVLERFPDAEAVVTADADGQHAPADIVRVAAETLRHPESLVIGVRTLPATAPLRSRFGNAWARLTFRLLTGVACTDTQTGLRGIPRALFARAVAVPGDRYDYELRFLADVACRVGAPVAVPIATIYLDGNRTSRFHPVRDALGTQFAFVRHVLALRIGVRFRRAGGMSRVI